MATARFTTAPFTCPSCVKKIETNVGKLNGVQSVSVMFNSNSVKVNFDNWLLSAQEIGTLIEKLGYPVDSIKVS